MFEIHDVIKLLIATVAALIIEFIFREYIPTLPEYHIDASLAAIFAYILTWNKVS